MLFSDIAHGSAALDAGELMKFAVDFGLSPKLISRRSIEAVSNHGTFASALCPLFTPHPVHCDIARCIERNKSRVSI